jgi:hypothetical protein
MIRALREPDLWDRLHRGIEAPTSATDCAARHAELFARLIARREAGADAARVATR